ncbi:MAG: EAL domain-containing protein [Chloroflexaceae bacterium]|nr:EAL domain-containing protein [Chloroflexaceae bacterium]
MNQWILLTACRQNKIWQEMGFPPLRVAVNLSPQQFFHPELVRLVQHVLDVTGLEPQWLDLEITEEAIMEDVAGACHILRQLRFLGVTIAIDDFGTGYSCLSTLQQLPLQTIKIDRSYVQNLTQRSETTMVAAIISLARSFNLRVVAEGVETRQQLAALQKLNCLEMQGYQLFRPLEVDQITLVLSRLSD